MTALRVRVRIIFVTILLFCALPVPPVVAQDPLLGAAAGMTGIQLIDALKRAASDIIREAGDVGRVTATSISNDLNKTATQLEGVLGRQVNRPLTELRITFSEQVDRALASFIVAQATADRLRTCVREDIAGILAATASTIRQTTGDVLPWAKGAPQVLSYRVLNDASEIGLRTGSASTVRLVGLRLASRDGCSALSAILVRPDNSTLPLRASEEGDNAATIEVPPQEMPGVYRVNLGVAEKSWFRCKPSQTSYSFAILPPAQFQLFYGMLTNVRFTARKEVFGGEFNQDNQSCDNDRVVNATYTAPDGWLVDDARWQEYSNVGATRQKWERSGPSGWYHEWRIERRARIKVITSVCRPGEGNRWIHGVVYLQVSRDSVTAGPRVEETQHPQTITFGQAVNIPVKLEPAEGQALQSWSAWASLIYPDGTRRDIPVQSGQGRLMGASPDGAQLSYDPVAKVITVVGPPKACMVR